MAMLSPIIRRALRVMRSAIFWGATPARAAGTLGLLIVLVLSSGAGAAATCPQPRWTAEKGPGAAELRWFKDELHISPKYVEEQRGFLGMSWAYFVVLIMLLAFLIGTLIVIYLRDRRTRQILISLLQEEQHESKG